uniref:Scyliorhinin-1 n=1 Tax=Scyliorhinus canicula TaxID=7830 RepID=TKN1_SCYCA|nr:RecName: Full=Scyliorhinin-1; AltName: Full=Scyliorhinin I [Scyliorhinus canicula]AAB27177.1 scyliorhinin I=tachykinin [Scyliorhinus canicula=european common dogfish, brain, Peptide, 10 aa] [Scyliorhinus canicula]2NOU_A Chain A, Scyliorhinin I [synthetic construct]
AKFDKFYGLM